MRLRSILPSAAVRAGAAHRAGRHSPRLGQELVRQIRPAALDPDQCYRVRDLTLAKEDLKLYFTEGYLIFSKPVNGERISAVFSADVEGGDGEVLLLPPYRGERAVAGALHANLPIWTNIFARP